jgi:hypothetical protein
MNFIATALQEANLPVQRERAGLVPDVQGRPNAVCLADLSIWSTEACEGAGAT